MNISIFDLFKIGIGPSSSHTVGPMKAAYLFIDEQVQAGLLNQIYRVKAEMFGSLGATGSGHGTPKAVILGLEGEHPEHIDVASIEARLENIVQNKRLLLNGSHAVAFEESRDIVLHPDQSLEFHANGMRFTAYAEEQQPIAEKVYYSVGGGFILDEAEINGETTGKDSQTLTYPFDSAEALLQQCQQHQLTISEIMLANENAWRSEDETRSKLLAIWQVMGNCVQNGISTEGILPGGLNVKRRAPKLYQQLLARPETSQPDPLNTLDWVSLYALAVNEENAAGGRMVTAPTNGAAGIIPAVLHYYMRFVSGANEESVIRFLLTAAAIGILYKKNASISGAEVGCQGEVGAACSMAAGALTEVLGGSPAQVENAAEIAMEHNLGLTCDPVGGLVQVPCIERNAMASIKAISASRMALRGDGSHYVSLDKVIRTMRDTGRDMQDKYKETSTGGLAVNVIPVNIIEC